MLVQVSHNTGAKCAETMLEWEKMVQEDGLQVRGERTKKFNSGQRDMFRRVEQVHINILAKTEMNYKNLIRARTQR